MKFDQDVFGARLQAMVQAQTIVALRTVTMELFGILGIEKAYFVSPVTRDPRVGRNLSNVGYPRVWERQYRARLRLVDPLPSIALRLTGAFVWPDIFAKHKPDPKGRRYMQLVARYGFDRGIGTACYGPQGRCGFIGAALPAEAPNPDDITRVRFNTVGQLSFQQYCRLVSVREELQPLSNRELEVLQLISRGKSNSVIAQLLGISPSSVDAYLRRIFAKLEVTDRTSASVKAFSLGLIAT